MNATTNEPTAAERELDLGEPLTAEPESEEEDAALGLADEPAGPEPRRDVQRMPPGSAHSLAPEADSREIQATNPTPTQMIHSAIQRGYDPDTLRQLMDLHKEWEANEARKAYYDAISNFRAEAPRIEKNQLVDYPQKHGNGRTTYRHATLDNVQRAVDPILARHGLNYRWDVQPQGNNILRVWCIVSHRAGHTESTYLDGPFDQSGQKNALQAMGSTQKYLQRYTLEAMLGVSSSEPDDDGRTGGGPPLDAPPHDDADPNVERITEEQRANIEDLLTEVALNPEQTRSRMLTHYWIRHLSELPADKYNDCIARLESMRQNDPDPK